MLTLLFVLIAIHSLLKKVSIVDYRSVPAFVWHRQNWSIVHPYIELSKDEVAEIQNLNHYVAGFTDATIEAR